MAYIVRKTLLGAFASTALVALASNSLAQTTEQFNQGIDRKPSKQIVLKPKDDIQGSTDESEILPSLNGVVIINSPDALQEDGIGGSGVSASGDVVPEAVIKAAEAHIGSNVSFASMDRLTRDMVLAFRDAGLPVVNVVIPPQDVSNGVLQIIAVVGRLGELTVEGNAANPDYYSDGFGLQKGDVVEENVVLDHLRWKSRRAHRRVDAIYSPGSSFSETDVALDVKEDKTWSAFIGADNTGRDTAVTLGEYRLFAGFTAGDLWGLDHEFSYQFTTSEDLIDSLKAHVFSYIMPVQEKTDFQLSGSYTVRGADFGGVIGATGNNYGLTGTFITQLERRNDFSWDARYGFDYKSAELGLNFAGIDVFGNRTEVGQFFAQIDGQRGNSKSNTNVYAGIWWSPGDLFDGNTNGAFNGARANSSAEYFYVRAGLEHTVYLQNDWQFNVELDGQWANERLIHSEQIVVGGFNTVRGFDEGAISGDSGGIARFELIGPAATLHEENRDALRFYGFLDAGTVSVNGEATVGEGSATIAGAGVGARYQMSDDFALEAAYGWAISNDELSADQDDGEFHFRILTSF